MDYSSYKSISFALFPMSRLGIYVDVPVKRFEPSPRSFT